mgnify:CR=1 FL=1|jgi:hypothetical protein
MSEEIEKRLVAVTPTYQAILNLQLKKVADALDAGNPIDGFIKLRTLILLLNPTDQKELMENDVAHIHAEVNHAMKIEGVDLYMTRRKRTSQVKSTLRRHLLELFRKVMVTLHNGGYLEKTRNVPQGRFTE